MIRLLSLTSIVLTICISIAHAQKSSQPPPPPLLPIDKITNLITYEEVVDVKDVSAKVLYSRIVEWYNTFYKNPKDVIRENDSLKFKVVGKPRFKVSNPPNKDGVKVDAGMVQYTITVAAKEGRFKYELTAYNWLRGSYYACERWYDTTSPSFTPANNDYLVQLDLYTKELISNLKKAVTVEKPVKDKDKW